MIINSRMRACFGVKTQQLISRVFRHPVHPSAAVQWRLAQSRLLSAGESKPRPSMLKHLTFKIKATGPITVAEYMREVLTNPVTLLGVWILSEWMGAGRPKHLQLVELGPGKGSLASDILRVFSQLKSVLDGCSVSLHLVEVSPALSGVQAQTLTGGSSVESSSEDDPVFRRGETSAGLPVFWYRRLEDLPAGFSIFIAHEFFDALPIHTFQRTPKGWREVLVDIDPEKQNRLRFVGFKGHRLHDVLSSPGSADLTADVDFSFLRTMTGGGVACLGPVTQKMFLKNMGIDARMEVLLRNCSDGPTRMQLIRSYDMLMNPEKMGERFLFFSLLHHSRLAKPKKTEGMKLEDKSPAPLPV
ncbi:hypothetical protein F7725_020013, partial [Dissostichus mawsoni]